MLPIRMFLIIGSRPNFCNFVMLWERILEIQPSSRTLKEYFIFSSTLHGDKLIYLYDKILNTIEQEFHKNTENFI